MGDAGRRGSSGWGRGAWAFLCAVALCAALIGGAIVAGRPTSGGAASAQGAPASGLQILSFHTQWLTDTGRSQAVVRGLVRNGGEGPAQWQGVRLELRDSTREPLAIGYTPALLPVLATGEDGPFEVRAVLPGTVDPGAVAIALSVIGTAAAADRDRSLRVHGVVSTTWQAEPALLGELANDGARHLMAAESRIHLAFFEGERIVALRAAMLPVVQGAGVEGQGHAPGESYPWLVVLPEEATRSQLPWRLWLVSEPYPEGRYPVPLGLLDTSFEDMPGADPPGVRARSRLVSCGFRSVAEARLVVLARDRDGALARFAAAWLQLPGPLAPGARVPVDIEIGGVALSDAETLDLRPYALASQAVPPTAWPCERTPRYARLWLPALTPDLSTRTHPTNAATPRGDRVDPALRGP